MTLAIQELLASQPDGAKAEAFLSGRRVPIVEGPSVTFVWKGEADAVNLRHWIYGLESSTSLARWEIPSEPAGSCMWPALMGKAPPAP